MYADKKDMHNFYNSIKSIYGLKNCSVTPLKTGGGLTLLKDQNRILLMWAEHFDALLNQHFSADYTILGELPERPPIHDLSQPPTATFTDVLTAVHALKNNNKSPGIDPAELLRGQGTFVQGLSISSFLGPWRRRVYPSSGRMRTLSPSTKTRETSPSAVTAGQ